MWRGTPYQPPACLDPKKLLATIKPWQWIVLAIVGGEEQFVAELGDVGCRDAGAGLGAMRCRRLGGSVVGLEEFVRLQPVDGHGQLTLVALDSGNDRGQLLLDGAQISYLIFSALLRLCGCRHDGENRVGMGGKWRQRCR
jgi:hypothetical protein